jgi:hypothetical protein
LRADPPSGKTPYFGFDIARAIAYRNIPPRISSASNLSIPILVISAEYTSVLSANIHAPDDGFVLVIASARMSCNGAGPSAAAVSLSIDSLTSVNALDHADRIDECLPSTATRTITFSYVLPVAPGPHVIHLLAANRGLAQNPVFADPSISLVFIDQDGVGAS